MPVACEALVAALSQACSAADADAALAALAAALAEDEGACDDLSEPPLACAAAAASVEALLTHGAAATLRSVCAACSLLCVSLPGALSEEEDGGTAASERAAAAVCAAAAHLGEADEEALHDGSMADVPAAAALLASAGSAAARAALRAGAAQHILAAALRCAPQPSVCLMLWYLTQDGGADALLALPGLGEALRLALSAAEGDAALAQAAAGAFAHLSGGADAAERLQDAVLAASAALEAHADDAGVVRFLSGGLGKLGSAGCAAARTRGVCAALGAALAVHRSNAALRGGILGALVACADADAQARELLCAPEAAAPFQLEVRPSRIAGAGSGLYVAAGAAVAPGALLSIYPGEVWDAPPPPAVADGNEYLAATPRGGAADGSAAAVARATQAVRGGLARCIRVSCNAL
jgi:hypothetical protein